jgi:hypothetical protein
MKTGKNGSSSGWIMTRIENFWNKLATHKHVFHLYEDETKFLEILAGFVGTGINADECTIVIATGEHIKQLKAKLEEHGLHIANLLEDERLLIFDAQIVLPTFMVGDMPDETLFTGQISAMLDIARKRNRPVRTFREMSSILWAGGNVQATIRLEQLWERYMSRERLLLFCAYPKFSLIDECKALREIGIRNLKLVTNADSMAHVYYKECPAVS